MYFRGVCVTGADKRVSPVQAGTHVAINWLLEDTLETKQSTPVHSWGLSVITLDTPGDVYRTPCTIKSGTAREELYVCPQYMITYNNIFFYSVQFKRTTCRVRCVTVHGPDRTPCGNPTSRTPSVRLRNPLNF